MNPHIENVVMQFDLPDGAWTAEPYGNGHINETYLVTTGEKRFILQRVNGYVFPKPEDVMDNIERVTAFLKAQIEREGGDPARETLTLVKTHRGECFTYDREGGLWRMYLFVEDTVSCDLPDTPALFELSGEAFGKFQRQMGGTTPRRATASSKTRLRATRPAGWAAWRRKSSFAGSTSGRYTRCWTRWRRAKSPCASPTTTPSSTTCCWIAKPGAACA